MTARAPLLLVLLAALAPASGAAAQSGTWEARVAEAAQEAAEAGSVSARLHALTQLIAQQEAGQSVLRADLARLSAEEARLSAEMAGDEDRTARLLAALERLGDSAAPLPLLHPAGALAAARAATMTTDMVAALTAERRALTERLASVRAARQEAAAAAARLDTLRSDTATARQSLIEAAARRGTLPPAYDSETAAAQTVALGISDLSELGRRLGPEPARGPEPAGMAPPMAGTVARAGDGWRIVAGPGAMAMAPAEGYVLYAGPLRGHRLVLVLELAPGRTLTLAGFGRLVAATGDRVQPGQALGFLPEAEAAPADGNTIVTAPAFTSGDLPRDTLYMETRDANRPVDPGRWFVAERDKQE